MTKEEAIEQLKQIPIHDAVSDNYIKSIYEAIDMAIEALEQTKWIPVSERLPEENGRYLTYIENPYYDRLSYIMICDYTQSTWCPDDEIASNNVTYWMPLPAKPYKEEEIIKMTYGMIYDEFCKKFPNAEVNDYRPAIPMYIPGLSNLTKGIPNAIVIWLKDGGSIIYIAEEVKDD